MTGVHFGKCFFFFASDYMNLHNYTYLHLIITPVKWTVSGSGSSHLKKGGSNYMSPLK